MPRVYDNIDKDLLPALRASLDLSQRADFCVGYFNLRGWKQIDDLTENYVGNESSCCRLLVGMQRLPQEELREMLSLDGARVGLDKTQQDRIRRKLADEFAQQLTFGAPNASDERALRVLARQLRKRKLVVKLFLQFQLHAKLYLLHRHDPQNPMIGYVGSSNLTFSGLLNQGELNVDVLDEDACAKLSNWFNERWSDLWCVDITDDLAYVIENSWARELPALPYHVYL